METSFEQKVKSMTASDIILAMVEGLVDPVTEIDMTTFGRVIEGVCYGCAATNAICIIGEYTKSDLLRNIYMDNSIDRGSLTKSDFLSSFELAIDFLRMGSLFRYNSKARSFAKISNHLGIPLPLLETNYTYEDLIPFIKLAMSQPDYQRDRQID